MARHGLPPKEWEIAKDLAEYKPKRGAPPKHVRRFLNGIGRVLATGAAWRDLPGRCGPWESAYARWRAYIRLGVPPRIIERLRRDAAEKGPMMLALACVDGPYARAHRHAAGAPPKTAKPPKTRPLNRPLDVPGADSRPKLHLIRDGSGRPPAMWLTPGNVHDSVVFEALFFGLLPYRARLKLRRRLRFLAGGKGCGAERIFQARRDQHVAPVIARRRGPNGEDCADPDFNRALYRQRNPVERCLGRLKQNRRVATRYEKRAATYQAMVQRAMIRDLAKAN